MIDNNNNTLSLKSISITMDEVIEDYRLAYKSRQASLIGRKEVMGGKAKFGIFGGGKEVAQLAMARSFKQGDFRSGYYRDQTWALAAGALTLNTFFAQLYAHADLEMEPATGGRQMVCHFATRSLNDDGSWKDLTAMKNSTSDISPTASQMPRLVGLAYASKLYRGIKRLKKAKKFSSNGNEIAWGTIGNASCAEGLFWESLNAIGVLNVPAIVSIWDDEFGISVPNEYQIARKDISRLLKGFQREKDNRGGFDLYKVKGWDYPALLETYAKAEAITRKDHTPAIIHVDEVTQPQGHSTSGSHERYKSAERLEWEKEHDCLSRMREWMISEEIITAAELTEMEKSDRQDVIKSRDQAWKAYIGPIRDEVQETADLLDEIARESLHAEKLMRVRNNLYHTPIAFRRDIMAAVHEALIIARHETGAGKVKLQQQKLKIHNQGRERYSTHLYNEAEQTDREITSVAPQFSENSRTVTGFELLNANFNIMFARDPRIIAFGEDVGQLGDVNQGFKGLQDKYGELRVSDTGIRECTIIGQAIGLALRGLRPIAEIQYLDYLLYAIQLMSDDLATVHWRTKGGQKAPVIIRTRGHRLEGVWHSGSPMGALVGLLRGVHILVPRNMTQAAGFYNAVIKEEDPVIIVEVLNGYRMKEMQPDNIGDFTLQPGIPEILREGSDITLVTYGACCQFVSNAADQLAEVGIEAEVIDVQSLLPFDINAVILDSLKKTSRIIFIDEDVPGGATAFMMQEVLERQNGFRYLDSQPKTVTSKPHRPAYGSDGDYWSKPGTEEIFEAAYAIMNEADPERYPIFY